MNIRIGSNYTTLNTLSEPDGIVVFGGQKDMLLPLCELKQAFGIEENLFNRSLPNLSVIDSIPAYDKYVLPLRPQTVIIHLGEADSEQFSEDSVVFDNGIRRLLNHIKEQNPNIRTAVVSIRKSDKVPNADDINRHLKYIAESERCEFCDISEKKIGNLKSTYETSSFLRSLGFVRPLKTRTPLSELTKILYGAENSEN